LWAGEAGGEDEGEDKDKDEDGGATCKVCETCET
jgi:hypothetical protein